MRILQVKFPNQSDSVLCQIDLLKRGFEELGHTCDIGSLDDRNKYDVVHTHWMSDVFDYDGPPLFMTLHGPRGQVFTHRGKNYDIGKYLADWNGVQGVSISNYQNDGLGLPMVYPGIDVDSFYSADKDSFYLNLARICPDKGQDIAARIARKSGWELVIAGKIHDKRFYYDDLEPLFSKKVRHIGYLGGDRKRQWLSNAKALLNPVRWGEAYAIVLVEAMASGCPVIGLDRGSLKEVVGDCGVFKDTEEELINIEIDIKPADCMARAKKFSYLNMCRGYLEVYK